MERLAAFLSTAPFLGRGRWTLSPKMGTLRTSWGKPRGRARSLGLGLHRKSISRAGLERGRVSVGMKFQVEK